MPLTEFDRFLKSRGLPMSVSERYKLGFDGEYIRIPLLDPWGVEICGTWRSVRRKEYLNPMGAPVHEYPYGLFQAKERGMQEGIFVTEGPFDAIAGDVLGYPTVAVLGSKMSWSQASWIWAYTDRVTLAFDADDAGRLATDKALAMFRSLGMGEIELFQMPPLCKDLSDVGRRLPGILLHKCVRPTTHYFITESPDKLLGIELGWDDSCEQRHGSCSE